MMAETDFDKIVYFVRHGESTGNVSATVQGTDATLTDRGVQQAERIAGRVRHLEFEALLSSPLPRATATAEAIAQATGKSIEYHDLFVERVKPTRLVGKSDADAEGRELGALYERSLHTPGLRAEDGENFDDLLARADNALEFLRQRPETSLVVVTHGYFLRTLIARVLLQNALTGAAFGTFQANIRSENTGLTAIKYGDGWEGKAWRLWIYNDHAHLG